MGTNSMRLAVYSDVHGNLPALEAVLEAIERHQVDGYIFAGDLVGLPQSNQTIARMRQVGGWMIRGNMDIYQLSYLDGDAPPYWHTSQQWAMTRWTSQNLSQTSLDFLRELPEQLVVELPNVAPIRVVHGSPRHISESIFPEDQAHLDAMLALVDEPVLICGHIHQAWQAERNGRLALNPGAVCGPLNGEPGAQYAILTWKDGAWQVEHHIVSYNIGEVVRACQESDFLEACGPLGRAILLCIKTGHDVTLDFLKYAFRRAEAAGYGRVEFVPDEIWAQATESFDWEAAEKGR